MNQIELLAASSDQTRETARLLTAGFQGGEILELCGPLGAGKTCFAKGLALGLGVPESEPIVSPTFVLLRRYEGRMSFIHVDVYRMGSSEELLDLGLEELRSETSAVIAVEWADRFPGALGSDTFHVETAYADAESKRRIVITPPSKFDSEIYIRSLREAGIWATLIPD